MKLDRNIPGNEGRGKYALLKLRVLDTFRETGPFGGGLSGKVGEAIETLQAAGVLDWGDRPDTEFFVIRLKDANAQDALNAYATAVRTVDTEFSDEVSALARRSGVDHPNCKRPD